MKIEYLDRDGVPKAERHIHAEIEAYFNKFSFTRNWIGFASFQLCCPGSTRDFDLVLLTHKHVICVELKNWNGKYLSDNGGGSTWFLDGRDRGTSPRNTVALKAKKLASELKKRKVEMPFVASVVVLHGDRGGIEKIEINEDVRKYVLTKDEFFKITAPHEYERLFPSWGDKRELTPIYTYQPIIRFLKGTEVSPRPKKVGSYTIQRHPVFEQENEIYSEFIGSSDDGSEALIREWDFRQNRFPDLLEPEQRTAVARREKRLGSYLTKQKSNLIHAILTSENETSVEDVGFDFSEVLKFRREGMKSLKPYIEAYLVKVPFDERLTFFHVLIDQIAQFHVENVHHNDLDPKNIWCGTDHDIALTGFCLADFPNDVNFRPNEVAVLKAPSDFPFGEMRDLWAIGFIAKKILLAKDDVPEEFREQIAELIAHLEKGTKFKSVRSILTELSRLRSSAEDLPLYSQKDFDVWMRSEDYLEDCERTDWITRERWLRRYKGLTPDKKPVLVSIWTLDSGIEKLSSDAAAVLTFFNRLNKIKNAKSDYVSKIYDFGIKEFERDRLFLIEENLEAKQTVSHFLEEGRQLTFKQYRLFGYTLIDTYQTYIDRDAYQGVFDADHLFIENFKPIIQLIHDFTLHGRVSADQLRQDNRKELYRILISLAGKVTDKNESLYAIRKIVSQYNENLAVPADLLPIKEAYESTHQTDSLRKQKNGEDVFCFDELQFMTTYNISEGPFLGKGLHKNEYAIKFLPDKEEHNSCVVHISGESKQLSVKIETEHKRVITLRCSEINPKSFVNAVTFRGNITLADDCDEDELYEILTRSEVIFSYIKGACKLAPKPFFNRKIEPIDLPDITEFMSILTLWKEILNAEIRAIQTWEVLDCHIVDDDLLTNNKTKKRMNLILDGAPDFDRIDSLGKEIYVLDMESEYPLKLIGTVNRNRSKGEDVVINRVKGEIFSGSLIGFISAGDCSSLRKRREALKKVDSQKFFIHNFSSYFEKNNDIKPEIYEVANTEFPKGVELDEHQKEAFRKVLMHGPISLLQGPPGTGKTRFISAFLLHILEKYPHSRVLLTSQSNEAVNNAIEKTKELCVQRGESLNAIRIGHEEKIPDSISWYAEKNIKKRYWKKLHVERSENVMRFASTRFGIPRELTSYVYELYEQVWFKILELPKNPVTDEDKKILRDKTQLINEELANFCKNIGIRTEVQFWLSARENLDNIVDSIRQIFDVDSVQSIKQLGELIALSLELETNLKNSLDDTSDTGKYSAFAIKTRNIVAGTLVGLASKRLELGETLFDWVIIDEASRSTASELAIVCQVARRILLVGDDKQLPPTYSREMQDCLKTNLHIRGSVEKVLVSDFERIYRSSYGEIVGCSMNLQYRMDPVIGSLVSECFYDGKLQNGRKSRNADFDRLLPFEIAASPVVWLDTSAQFGLGAENEESKTNIYNMDEARAIVALLVKIFSEYDKIKHLRDRNTDEPMVGVISMYGGQRRKIVELLKKESSLMPYWKTQIKVDSVDGYQGKENQIIILSTVRSKYPGFLRSEKRVNVAVSRARDLVVIFGSVRLWNKYEREPLGKVLNYVKNNNLPVSNFASLLN